MQHNESEIPSVGWISSRPRWTGEDYAFLTFTLGIIGLIIKFFYF